MRQNCLYNALTNVKLNLIVKFYIFNKYAFKYVNLYNFFPAKHKMTFLKAVGVQTTQDPTDFHFSEKI